MKFEKVFRPNKVFLRILLKAFLKRLESFLSGFLELLLASGAILTPFQMFIELFVYFFRYYLVNFQVIIYVNRFSTPSAQSPKKYLKNTLKANFLQGADKIGQNEKIHYKNTAAWLFGMFLEAFWKSPWSAT